MNNAVRSFRRRHDLTQQDLADAIGTTRQTVISIEQGRYKPSVELALKIAKSLGTAVEELFFLEDDHENSRA